MQLTSGQFVVSHGWNKSDPVHRVVIVGADGRTRQSYGGPRGPALTQLDAPVRIAVDKNGFILVADQKNRRVLVLSPTLSYVCQLLTPQHFTQRWKPYRMCINSSNNSVYIAEREWKDNKYVAGRVTVVRS